MTSIVWHLTQNLLVVAVLAPLVSLACRWWHDRPAVQHALWTVLLIKLILPPVFHSPAPQLQSWLSPLTPLTPLTSDLTPGHADQPAQPDHPSTAQSGRTPADSRHADSQPALPQQTPSQRPGSVNSESGIADSRPSDRRSITGPKPAPKPAQPPTLGSTTQSRSPSSNQQPRSSNDPQTSSIQAATGSVNTVAANTVAANTVAANSPPTAQPRFAWPRLATVVVGIWIAGALITGLRETCRLARHWRIVRRATPAPDALQQQLLQVARRMRTRPVPLSVVAGISSPLVWCLGRVHMLWPRRLATGAVDQRFRAVMAHELAHIRRRDHWIAWLELVVGLIWWWNPLFWWIRHRLRDAAEMACDAEALRVWPEDRHSYAETFLELSLSSKNGAPVPVLGVSTGAHQSFRRRLSMMLSDRVSGKISAAGFLAATALTLVAVPTWSWGQNPGGRAESERRIAAEAKLRAEEAYRKAIAEENEKLADKKRADEDRADENRVSERAELDQLNQRLQALERSLDRIAKIAESTQQQAARERADLLEENDRRLRRLEAMYHEGHEGHEGVEGKGEEDKREGLEEREEEDREGVEEREDQDDDREADDDVEQKGEAGADERLAEVDRLHAFEKMIQDRHRALADQLKSSVDEALQHAGAGENSEETQAEIQAEVRQALTEAQQELQAAAREIQDQVQAEYKARWSDDQRQQIEAIAAEAAAEAKKVASDAQTAARDAIHEAQHAAAVLVAQAQQAAKQAIEQSKNTRPAPVNLKWHNQQGVLTLTDEQSGRVIARLKVSGDQRVELDGTRLRVSGPDGQDMLLELSAEPAPTDPAAPVVYPPTPPTPPSEPAPPPTAPAPPVGR